MGKIYRYRSLAVIKVVADCNQTWYQYHKYRYFGTKCNGWILVRREGRDREKPRAMLTPLSPPEAFKGLLFQKRTAGMYGTGTLTFVLRVIKHLGRTADGVNLYQCQYMRLACAQRASVLWRVETFSTRATSSRTRLQTLHRAQRIPRLARAGGAECQTPARRPAQARW